MIPSLLVGAALLILGIVLIAVTATILIRIVAASLRRGYAQPIFWKNVAILVLVALVETAAHLLQISAWAVTFMACGEFPGFRPAFYHSAVNYTTLGYGDVVMSERWKLLGPLEALGGVLLLGISTAIIFAVMARMFEHFLTWQHAHDEASDVPAPRS